MSLPRYFFSVKNSEPPRGGADLLYQGGTLISSFITVIFPFGKGGVYFIRTHNPEPPGGGMLFGRGFYTLRRAVPCLTAPPPCPRRSVVRGEPLAGVDHGPRGVHLRPRQQWPPRPRTSVGERYGVEAISRPVGVARFQTGHGSWSWLVGLGGGVVCPPPSPLSPPGACSRHGDTTNRLLPTLVPLFRDLPPRGCAGEPWYP